MSTKRCVSSGFLVNIKRNDNNKNSNVNDDGDESIQNVESNDNAIEID